MEEFYQWRQAYEEDSLWRHGQTPDPLVDYRIFALGRMWEQARTDPDDLHLAPERRPALCQNDEIIDWIVNQKEACKNAELMVQSMLSVLPEGFAAEPRLRGWISSLENTFPRMAEAANIYLRTTTGSSLRWLHSQAVEAVRCTYPPGGLSPAIHVRVRLPFTSGSNRATARRARGLQARWPSHCRGRCRGARTPTPSRRWGRRRA